MTDRPAVAYTFGITEGLVFVAIVFLSGFFFFGCGIKGPPVPPRQPPVAAVTQLTYQVAGQSVTLTWSLPGPLSGKPAKQARFVLYRSRTGLDEPACNGCPQVFEKVITIPYIHTPSDRFSTDLPLDPGYRYVFKVRLETNGGSGPDSNPVQFDALPNMPPGGAKAP